jgi:hypothetical protein
MISYAAAFLPPFLESRDPIVRGHSLWVAGALPLEKNIPYIQPLAQDSARFKLFLDREIMEVSIGKLAAKLLRRTDS